MTAPKLTQLSLWGEANAYDEARAYRHPHTGEKYPSVTSVLKMADKSGMSQWAADKAMDWAVENWHLLGSRSTEDAHRAGRFQWKKVRDERAEIGTGIHETIEAEHTGQWALPELNEEQLRIMEHWRMLNEEHEIVPVLSEFTVFFSIPGHVGGYAGTADGYWMIDGERCLVDVKTSKNMWPEHNYQLAALWAAPEWVLEVSDMVWESRAPEPIDKVAIVHLREDKHEIHYIDDMEENFKAFMGYHDVWYAKEAIKKAEKERKAASYGF